MSAGCGASKTRSCTKPVVVPSLEDALIGILFNHNVQAVVVRPGLRLKSGVELPILKRYLNGVGGAEGLKG